MKIIFTFSLFVLSTTILFSAPAYFDKVGIITKCSEYKCISELPNELKFEVESGIIWNELTSKNEISSINGSFMNFQSLERGRRILEKKYNLYT